jgi:hypothetical protein
LNSPFNINVWDALRKSIRVTACRSSGYLHTLIAVGHTQIQPPTASSSTHPLYREFGSMSTFVYVSHAIAVNLNDEVTISLEWIGDQIPVYMFMASASIPLPHCHLGLT